MEAFDDDEEARVPTPLINLKVFNARLQVEEAIEVERETGKAERKVLIERPDAKRELSALFWTRFEAETATMKARQHLGELLREALPLGDDFQKQCREKAKREAANLLTGLGDKCTRR